MAFDKSGHQIAKLHSCVSLIVVRYVAQLPITDDPGTGCEKYKQMQFPAASKFNHEREREGEEERTTGTMMTNSWPPMVTRGRNYLQ